MKILFFFGALLLTAVMISTSPAAVTKATKHSGVTNFDTPVRLQGVLLQGQYLFVHDDLAMGRGEVCTRVYKGNIETPDKLVVSFHCTPVERKKAAHFTWRSREVSPGIVELREYQFAGETESHLAPSVELK